MGLAICSKLTAMMGGTVTAESAEGAGSCFKFEIPLAENLEEDVIANVASPVVKKDSQELLSFSVLLVEDNAVNRLVAVKILE